MVLVLQMRVLCTCALAGDGVSVANADVIRCIISFMVIAEVIGSHLEYSSSMGTCVSRRHGKGSLIGLLPFPCFTISVHANPMGMKRTVRK